MPDDPIDLTALRQELVRPGGLWRQVDHVAETGSTNADLAAAARAGDEPVRVLITDYQSAGRGRLGRTWTAPPGTGIAMSVLVRPEGVDPTRWTWLPLLAGLAVQEAVARLGAVDTRLKWPNDLLLGDDLRKAGGILVQSDGVAVVVGIGLNVTTKRDELPSGGTSLAVEAAACTDRDPLLRAVLRALGTRYREWGGGDLRPAYEAVCDTVGREVRVQLPDGGLLTGTATGLDDSGRLLVETAAGERAVSAGDVLRVRPVPTG